MSKVSIIVPIYNGEKYIDNFVKMVLSQSFKDFELLLINDGSSDNSLIKCMEIKQKDSRIKVISKENTGAWDTRNKGIEEATGKYIVFWDCDDYADSTYLEKMYNAIESNNFDLVICGQIDIISKGNIKTKKIIKPEERTYSDKSKFRENYISLREEYIADTLWNKIYKNNIIQKNNIRFNKLKRGEDVEFNINYYNYVNSCKILEESLYYYNVDGNNPPWLKYSEEFLACVEKENEIVVEKLEEWGVFNDKAKEYQARHLVNGVVGQIFYIVNKKDVTFLYKKKSIEKLISKTNVNQAIYNSKFKTIYRRILIYLIKKKQLNLIMLYVMMQLKIKGIS